LSHHRRFLTPKSLIFHCGFISLLKTPLSQLLGDQPRMPCIVPPSGTGIYTTFLHGKNNGLQQCQAPSPAGEGQGEENKIKWLYSPPLIPAFSLKGEGATTCLDTHAPSGVIKSAVFQKIISRTCSWV